MTNSGQERTGTLLITGATGGMGRATALLAAERGHDLLLADLSGERLAELAAGCEAFGVEVGHQVLDVTRQEHRQELVRRTAGGLTGIVHTVGLSPQMADWQRIVEVDLTATVAMLEELRPQLLPGACAVAISSMSSYLVPEDQALERRLADTLQPGSGDGLGSLAGEFPPLQNSGMAYAYAKKALRAWIEDSAGDWGSEGKRLASISPGLIDTEMGRLENKAMDNFEAMFSMVALGRLGDPADIARAALYLVSPEAAYVSGCDLLVDGGFVARFKAAQRQAG